MTSSMQSTKYKGPIGLIGAGRMGRCMVERMVGAGLSVIAYDAVPQALEWCLEKGASVAASPAELARKARLVILSLPASKNVADAVDALLDGVQAGCVVVDTSTIDPETSRAAAAKLAKKGAMHVDAPILGRPSTVGNWILPAGGQQEAVDFAAPLMASFIKNIVRVGDHGAGNAFKLLNQLMFSVINGISAEVMALTDVLGVDKKVFYDLVVESGAATVSGLFKETAGRIVRDDYLNPTFTIELLCKDAGLGLQMVRPFGVKPRIASFVQEINEAAKKTELATQDTSSLYKAFKKIYADDVKEKKI